MTTRRTGVISAVILVMSLGQVSAQFGENLAQGKAATQSSTLGTFRAELAVDGQRGNFSHTSPRAELPGPAWWQVDLQETFDISSVVLWNRTSCCGSRLRDIIVQVLAEDGDTVVFQTTDPDAPEAARLLNPENALGAFPNGPASLSVSTGLEPVEGRFVRVLRLPDEDLSGSGGAGTSLEATTLSLGEVEVYSADGCPDEGDTHCDGLDGFGPAGNDTVGTWTFTAFATDESGDLITYNFIAVHESGTTVQSTDVFETTTLNLALAGAWTVSVTVDDDALCGDEADDATCTDTFEVEPRSGFTDENGLILTKGFLVLGPFAHPFGCGGPQGNLLANHIANARIDCEYPVEGDPIDYQADTAASTAYLGPEVDGVPTWRAFNDATPDNGDQDLSQDVGALDDVMSWLVTYVEYTGGVPAEIAVCLGKDDGGQVWFDDLRVINDSSCSGRSDCNVMSELIVVEPGVHRIAAAAWNRAGGWGLRLSLLEDLFLPIVDEDARFRDWIFHGPTPPRGFEPPECATGGCNPEPVTNLVCEVTDDGMVLTWENPDVVDANIPTRIEVDDGFFGAIDILTVPSDATTAVIPEDDLPEGFVSIRVIHCGGVAAECSPFRTDPSGFITGDSFLILGPFTHPFRCNGPSDNLLRNHLAPSDMACLYPEEGDEVPYDPDHPETASTGYVGPVGPTGLPVIRRFDDGSAQDGDQNLNGDLGQRNDVLSWLMTYVEYVGAGSTPLTICFGSGDGGQIWVNDQPLITNPKCRNRGDCQDQVTIDIQGPMVLRIAAGAWNSGGSWGLRVQLRDEDGPIVDSVNNRDWVFHGSRKPVDGSFPPCAGAAADLLPADVNLDGMFNLADAVAHLNFLFSSTPLDRCLVVPGTIELTAAGLTILDFNGDGSSNIADAVSALSRLFSAGAPHALGEQCIRVEGACAAVCGN